MATSVPQIIENIPTLDIIELIQNVYEEYKTGCEENNTQPRCKLEHLPTKYGGKISMLLSQETFRPRIFFNSKLGTTLSAHPIQTD